MEDNYELKCQSTDNEDILNEKVNQVLVPEKKNIGRGSKSYNFKNLSESILFQIILILLGVAILYYGAVLIISMVTKSPTAMKGGRRFK
jgi:hypothetical protein